MDDKRELQEFVFNPKEFPPLAMSSSKLDILRKDSFLFPTRGSSLGRSPLFHKEDDTSSDTIDDCITQALADCEDLEDEDEWSDEEDDDSCFIPLTSGDAGFCGLPYDPEDRNSVMEYVSMIDEVMTSLSSLDRGMYPRQNPNGKVTFLVENWIVGSPDPGRVEISLATALGIVKLCTQISSENKLEKARSVSSDPVYRDFTIPRGLQCDSSDCCIQKEQILSVAEECSRSPGHGPVTVPVSISQSSELLESVKGNCLTTVEVSTSNLISTPWVVEMGPRLISGILGGTVNFCPPNLNTILPYFCSLSGATAEIFSETSPGEVRDLLTLTNRKVRGFDPLWGPYLSRYSPSESFHSIRGCYKEEGDLPPINHVMKNIFTTR